MGREFAFAVPKPVVRGRSRLVASNVPNVARLAVMPGRLFRPKTSQFAACWLYHVVSAQIAGKVWSLAINCRNAGAKTFLPKLVEKELSANYWRKLAANYAEIHTNA